MPLPVPAHALIELFQINGEKKYMRNFSKSSPSIISVVVTIIMVSSAVYFANRRWFYLVQVFFVSSARSPQLNFVNYWHII